MNRGRRQVAWTFEDSDDASPGGSSRPQSGSLRRAPGGDPAGSETAAFMAGEKRPGGGDWTATARYGRIEPQPAERPAAIRISLDPHHLRPSRPAAVHRLFHRHGRRRCRRPRLRPARPAVPGQRQFESLRQRCAVLIALWRGNIAGWRTLPEATALRSIHEGNLGPAADAPVPQPAARCPSTSRTIRSARSNPASRPISNAVEAGTHEQGVETIRADSLCLASRETVHVHEASGAATELVEIVRRDRLVPLTADSALALREGRPVVNTRSKRAAVVVPAPSRMFEDGGVQARVRLARPAAREAMAADELAASNWEDGVVGCRDRSAAEPYGSNTASPWTGAKPAPSNASSRAVHRPP